MSKTIKKMHDLICASGANITHMEHIASQKYVSKTKMRESLKKQMQYLQDMTITLYDNTLD